MRIVRAGIMEYDKRTAPKVKACGWCGCEIPARKTYCGPCYDERLMANIEANRQRHAANRKARLRGAARSTGDVFVR